MTLEIITRTPPEGTAKRPTPLLCVHGILHGAWAYDEYFLPHLAEHGYMASALSLREHGDSSLQGSLRWVTIGQYVQDVAAAAAQLEQKYGARPVIIGHSMGGLITQKYLERHQAPAGVLLTSVPTHGAVLATLRALRKDPLRLMVLGAENDAFFSPGEVIRTAKAYNAEYRVFPGIAHDVMLEANWQQVADYMVDWLQARGL